MFVRKPAWLWPFPSPKSRWGRRGKEIKLKGRLYTLPISMVYDRKYLCSHTELNVLIWVRTRYTFMTITA